jgi:rhodanese-related sulfurtransferase
LLSNDFAVIIDIREDTEAVNSFRIEKAKAIPYSKIEADDVVWQEVAKTVPLNKQYIFVGMPNDKAAKLAERYTKKGYTTNYIVDIEEWKKAGLPIKQ